VSTYDFLGLLHTSLELGDISLRLIFRQLVDFIFSDHTQRLLCVEFPLTYMPCIGCAGGGHLVWWSREKSGSRASDEGKPKQAALALARQAGWLAGASLAGWPRREAVKRRAATARERVEAAKMGVKKRVNLRAKYAVRRGNIVMAVVVVVDGLRRV
jgi:hypothetical protein